MIEILGGIQSTIVFIIVLSVLIVVHEWGHFITAKLLGINVEEFSLGFGPKLWSKKHNGTEYMVKAIPLGGYVKMSGDERQNCKGEPDEFYSKSVGARSLVVFNGPLVNLIMGYLCFILVFMLGYPGVSTKIMDIKAGSPAQEAGLRVGDEIVALDSKRVYGWMNLDERVVAKNGEPIDLTFSRDGVERTVTVQPELIEKPDIFGNERMAADIGVLPYSAKIGFVTKKFPAEAAGIQEGDLILSIDGKPVSGWEHVQEAIRESKDDAIVFEISRDGQKISKSVTPKIVIVKNADGSEHEVRQVGISPHQEVGAFRFGLVNSVTNAWEKTVQITVLTYKSLYYMVVGKVSAKESVTGPIGIFYIVKNASETGMAHLLYIVGLISVSLALFNLLPMFPLDGGHLFLYLIEKIRGKELPPKVDDIIARVGVTIILALAAFVFYSDFARFGWIDKVMGIFTRG